MVLDGVLAAFLDFSLVLIAESVKENPMFKPLPMVVDGVLTAFLEESYFLICCVACSSCLS